MDNAPSYSHQAGSITGEMRRELKQLAAVWFPLSTCSKLLSKKDTFSLTPRLDQVHPIMKLYWLLLHVKVTLNHVSIPVLGWDVQVHVCAVYTIWRENFAGALFCETAIFCFARNFCGFYFHVSRMRQLTTPLSDVLLCRVFMSMKNWTSFQLPSGKAFC